MSDESAESVEGTGSPDSHDNPDNPDSPADAGTGRDWSELNGAYGPATEVPEALAGLTDPDLADDAIDDLYSVVLHQGTLYSASGPAVVEVARLLAADRCANPAGALGLVAYYGQCVTEHRAALSFLRAYPRGYRRAEDRLREFQARLDEATDVLAPLLAELDSFDPLEAQALVLLQAQRSRLDSRRAAALSVLARSAAMGESDGLESAIARAAAFALGRHDLSTPDTSEARACALLGRVAGHRADEGDVRALVADWSTAQRVADVCLNELTDDLPDSSLPMWLAITDPRLAAAVLTALPVDAHLMIEDADRWAPAYAEAGAAIVTTHIEATTAPFRLADELHRLGAGAGIALRPTTPLSAVEHLLGRIDLLLLMTVEPGFGGQSFIEAMLPKIERARRLVSEEGLELRIQIDGGVTAGTIERAAEAGAGVFVAGSAVYGADDAPAAIARLRDLAAAHTR